MIGVIFAFTLQMIAFKRTAFASTDFLILEALSLAWYLLGILSLRIVWTKTTKEVRYESHQ